MNYMQAVEFIKMTDQSIKARVFYQKREQIFTPPFNRIQIVPAYIIHEAIFQTGGRLIRQITHHKKAGIVASFRDFKFLRPLLPNEIIIIDVCCIKTNETSAFFRVKVSAEDELLLTNGSFILLLTESILSPHLNNQMPNEREEIIEYFKQEMSSATKY